VTRRKKPNLGPPSKKKPLSAHEAGKFAPYKSPEPASPLAQDKSAADEIGAGERPPTPRELEMLALMAERMNDRQIAAHFDVEISTIHKHTENLFKALGVHSRADAVAWYWARRYRESEREKESLLQENIQLRMKVEELERRVKELGG
jgi:DNA-binding CsgD family transcriptional regulator